MILQILKFTEISWFESPSKLEDQLALFLQYGGIAENGSEQITLRLERHLADRITNHVKIEIYSKEHAPPHFHVVANGIDASFEIETCNLLDGSIPDRKLLRKIKLWHSFSKPKLIEFWNQKRPENCPVGRIL